MLADIRRRVRTEHVRSISAGPSPISNESSTFQFKAVKLTKHEEAETIASAGEFEAIKRDLIKTFILAAIAISGELAIYFLSHRNI